MVALVAFVLLGERVSRRQLLGLPSPSLASPCWGWGGRRRVRPNALLGNSLEMGAMLCATYSVVFKSSPAATA
jgi:drug/metabolite transporter (DMT)-like permease